MNSRLMKLVTININGLHSQVKRWKVQIVLMQETHLGDKDQAKLSKLGFKHILPTDRGGEEGWQSCYLEL